MSRKLEIELETRIVRKCAEDAIAQGYAVSVNDGEETTLKKSTDITAIMAAICSTDEDYLIFHRNTGVHAGGAAHASHQGEPQTFWEKAGWARFIYGNVECVLSDYSANEATNAIVAGANALAAEYE